MLLKSSNYLLKYYVSSRERILKIGQDLAKVSQKFHSTLACGTAEPFFMEHSV